MCHFPRSMRRCQNYSVERSCDRGNSPTARRPESRKQRTVRFTLARSFGILIFFFLSFFSYRVRENAIPYVSCFCFRAISRDPHCYKLYIRCSLNARIIAWICGRLARGATKCSQPRSSQYAPWQAVAHCRREFCIHLRTEAQQIKRTKNSFK